MSNSIKTSILNNEEIQKTNENRIDKYINNTQETQNKTNTVQLQNNIGELLNTNPPHISISIINTSKYRKETNLYSIKKRNESIEKKIDNKKYFSPDVSDKKIRRTNSFFYSSKKNVKETKRIVMDFLNYTSSNEKIEKDKSLIKLNSLNSEVSNTKPNEDMSEWNKIDLNDFHQDNNENSTLNNNDILISLKNIQYLSKKIEKKNESINKIIKIDEEINMSSDMSKITSRKSIKIKIPNFGNESFHNTLKNKNFVTDMNEDNRIIESNEILEMTKDIKSTQRDLIYTEQSQYDIEEKSVFENELEIEEEIISNKQKPRRYIIKNMNEGREYFKYRFLCMKIREVYSSGIKKNYDNNLRLRADDRQVINFSRYFLIKMETAYFQFNLKKFFESYNLLKEASIIISEEEFAEVLLIFNGFDKSVLGDFLSKNKGMNKGLIILHFFIHKLNFEGMTFLDAFRFLWMTINPPKDSNLILEIINIFTIVYEKDNPEYYGSDDLYLLCSTIMALNTSLHKKISTLKPLPLESFIKMNTNISKEDLTLIYNELKSNKLDFKDDYQENFIRLALEIREINEVEENDKGVKRGTINNEEGFGTDGNIYDINIQNHEDKYSEMLTMLKKGEKFLKYCSNGESHLKFIFLSKDEKFLVWKDVNLFSIIAPSKKIDVKELRQCYYGIQQSEIFHKNKVKKENENNCFSIVAHFRTLDLQHENIEIVKTWFRAMREFISKSQSNEKLKRKTLKSSSINIVKDIWINSIIPNWSRFREILFVDNNHLNENQKKKEKLKVDKTLNKKIEEDKTVIYYVLSLGIPNVFRNKIWRVLIDNKLKLNEIIFIKLLERLEEEIKFYSLNTTESNSFSKSDNTTGNQLRNLNFFSPYLIFKSRNRHQMNNIKKSKKVSFSSTILMNIIDEIEKIIQEHEISSLHLVNYNITETVLSQSIGDIFPNVFKEGKIFQFKKEVLIIILTINLIRPDIIFNPELAYIVLILLLNCENYYNGFILISNLLINSYIIDHLTDNSKKTKEMFSFFDKIFKKKLPNLYNQFQIFGYETNLFYYDWIPFFFCKFFKHKTIIRLFDIFLIRKDVFVYEVALAILIFMEKDLRQCTVDDIRKLLSRFNTKYIEDDFFDLLFTVDLSNEYKALKICIDLAYEKSELYEALIYDDE